MEPIFQLTSEAARALALRLFTKEQFAANPRACIYPNNKKMKSFKRLSPYIGPAIPGQVRQNAKDLWPNIALDSRNHPGGWEWSAGSGTYECELSLCDMDAETVDPAGYVAIVPMQEGVGYTEADFSARIEEQLSGKLPRALEDCRPKKEPIGYCIRFVLHDKKFRTDEEVAAAKIFESIPQAKAFLDSILAFETPQIPAPK
jgi:hypothetical protein